MSTDSSQILKDDQKTEVCNIYHLSDIHIRNNQRHDEYREVFERTYKMIETEVGTDRDSSLILITGDIMHSKTELSPESIKLVWYLFKNLVKIAPLIVIPGNHDCNMSNRGRLDALTPIVEDIGKLKDFYYLKNTGYYQYNNIIFGLTGLHEKFILPPSSKKMLRMVSQKNKYNIALYHGGVYNDDLVKTISTDNKFTPDNFKGYDRVLLGDFHRHQYLDNERHIAYAGSLIQQSFGEDQDGHGFIKWNLKEDFSELIQVKNNYGFCTVNINSGKMENVKLPKKPYIRFRVSNTNPVQYKEIVDSLEAKYDIQGIVKDPVLVAGGKSKSEKKKRSDVPQEDRILTYVKTKGIDEEKYTKLINLHNYICKEIHVQVVQEESKTQRWSIHELRFSNMLSYGENNVIDFTKYDNNRTVGIVAPNHYGKSAILDIILFCLFDKFSRSKSIRDIMNKNRKDMFCSLLIKVGSKKYLIERYGKRTKGGKGVTIETSVDFYCINKKEEKNKLNGDTKIMTNKLIIELIGQYDDYLATCFCLQGRNSSFLDMTQLDRKEYLSSILKLNIYEECHKFCQDKLKIMTGELSILEKIVGDKSIDEIKESVTTIKNQLAKVQSDRDYYTNLIDSLNYLIDGSNHNLVKYAELKKYTLNTEEDFHKLIEQLSIESEIDNSEDPHELTSVETDLERLNEDLSSLREKSCISDKRNELKQLYKNIINTNNENYDINELKKLSDSLTEKLTALDVVLNDPNMKDINKVQERVQFLKSSIKNWRSQLKIIDHDLITQSKELENEYISLSEQYNELMDGMIHQNVSMNETKDAFNARLDEKESTVVILEYILSNTEEKGILKYCTEKKDEYHKSIHKIKNMIMQCENRIYINQVNECKQKREAVYNSIHECNDHIMFDRNNIILEKMISDAENELEQLGDHSNDTNKFKERELLQKELDMIKNKIDRYQNYLVQNEQNSVIEEKIEIINKEIEEFEKKEKDIIKNQEEVRKRVNELKKIIAEKEENIKENQMRHELKGIVEKYYFEWQNKELSDGLNRQRYFEREKIEKKIKECDQTISRLTAEFDILKRDMKSTIKKREEYDTKADEVQMYQLYSQMTHHNGLPYEILKEHLPQIEQDVNETLRPMVDFSIEFMFTDKDPDTTNKKKTGTGFIDINLVRSNVEPYNVQLASGFEKFIVGLAIRMTLSQISLTAKPNFLVIDEGWSCLDNENLNNVNQIMQYIKNQYEYVIIISHQEQLKDQCDDIININRKDGFSYVTN